MWSWLSNPAVTLVGFLSALITIVQLVISIVRLIREASSDEGKRHVLIIGAVLAALVAVAVMSVLSWTPIMSTAATSGSSGIMAVLYPLIVDGMGAAGCAELLSDARRKRRPAATSWYLICIGLAYAISAYGLSLAPDRTTRIISAALVATAPPVSLFAVQLTFWRRRSILDQPEKTATESGNPDHDASSDAPPA